MFDSAPTTHNSAQKGDFAKTVLMPGDPLRSKYIAENYLENAVLVNNVRGVEGYTGEYKGAKVSVMASGMGIPSMGIYSYELYNFYDVENIIRIGSCGAVSNKVKVLDVVISQSASTNSNYANVFGFPGSYAPTGDFGLITQAQTIAKEMKIPVHVGPTMCCDEFYHSDSDLNIIKKMGILALEMETVALYLNALVADKKAIAMFTVADAVIRPDISLNPDQREQNLDKMIVLALETAIKI